MKLTEDLKMFCNYRRLKEIKRCNNFPVINREDVAQHSFYVTLLAMAIADEYNTWAEGEYFENPEKYHPLVNTEVLLRKSLLHDTSESMTSDIPWNIKHMNEEINEILTEAIDKRIKEAYTGTKTMELYYQLSKDCKKNLEGQFVGIADMLELGLYCYEERVKGNHLIQPLLDKCIELVKNNTLYSVLSESSSLFISVLQLIENYDDSQTAEQLINVD